jgi:hypothetical protein
MFLLGSPTNDRIRRILKSEAHSPFSYSNTGATRTLLPEEYDVRTLTGICLRSPHDHIGVHGIDLHQPTFPPPALAGHQSRTGPTE